MNKLDKALSDIRDHTGDALKANLYDGTAAVILAYVGLAEREVRTEREEAFNRITALRLALRQIADEADASEPISVKVARWAEEALGVDGTVCTHPRLTYQDTPSGETERATCLACGKSWLEEVAQ